MEYGLIGQSLGHSYSPTLHSLLADYSYALRELAPAQLGPFLTAGQFRGLNVTIPYKQAVLPYLSQLSPVARRIGAVNTILNRDGRLVGHNTDYDGLMSLARQAGIDPAGGRVLILGTGGAARTAHAVMEDLGAAEILHTTRQPGGLAAADAARLYPDTAVIVNATPVGMRPDDTGAPIHLSGFSRLRGVLDVVYNPLRTRLVLQAQALGIPAAGGLWMLAAQAVYAAALFQDIPADPARIRLAYEWLLARKQNLVLIGMPTCGKTTVGRRLSEKTGRPFYDTDEILSARLGMAPGEYITRCGEAAFRAAESALVAELTRLEGAVIATGGGTVLDPGNVQALKGSGQLVFLDRQLALLTPAPDRPLSADPEALARLYEARRPVYLAAADRTVNADGAPQAVANAVLQEVKP